MISVRRIIRPAIITAWRAAWVHPAHAGWWTAFGLTLALSAWMLLRRIQSSFHEPLPASVVVFVSLVLVGWCALLRRQGRSWPPSRFGQSAQWVVAGAISLSCLLFMAAVSLAGTRIIGLMVAWCIVIASEASWWTRQWAKRRAGLALRPATLTAPDHDAANYLMTRDSHEDSWPAEVMQRITRVRRECGGESLIGGLQVEFRAGERSRSAHLAFCPPLDQSPEFHVEQSGGPPASIEVVQLEPFGVRLEVKLERTTESQTSVVVLFEAICGPR